MQGRKLLSPFWRGRCLAAAPTRAGPASERARGSRLGRNGSSASSPKGQESATRKRKSSARGPTSSPGGACAASIPGEDGAGDRLARGEAAGDESAASNAGERAQRSEGAEAGGERGQVRARTAAQRMGKRSRRGSRSQQRRSRQVECWLWRTPITTARGARC